ncbi:CALM1 [Branchiostoma lanceolatum]|uniref:CALM1 protein n=1 Tax=Branchiostoma lanceolatum TaxID=7740 RepID=A0A8J9Z069_BRALA|nr:CALM1 [Branchiostoma lanceolatum]
MATRLTTENIAQFQEIFNAIADGNGIIGPKELRAWIQSMGQDPTDEDVKGLIADADLDNTGNIKFYEFLRLMDQIMTFHREARLRKMFQELDRDEDDYIIAADLTCWMTWLTRQEAEEMIHEADRDKDGKVSYPEFQKVMGPA